MVLTAGVLPFNPGVGETGSVTAAAPKPVCPAPYLFPPNQLIPKSRPTVRSASRKRTFSITCCEGATFMASMTGVFGERPLATSTARAAETASLASPLSTTSPFALATLMLRAPVVAKILLCTDAASSATSRSTTAISRFSMSNTEMLVVPTFLPWT